MESWWRKDIKQPMAQTQGSKAVRDQKEESWCLWWGKAGLLQKVQTLSTARWSQERLRMKSKEGEAGEVGWQVSGTVSQEIGKKWQNSIRKDDSAGEEEGTCPWSIKLKVDILVVSGFFFIRLRKWGIILKTVVDESNLIPMLSRPVLPELCFAGVSLNLDLILLHWSSMSCCDGVCITGLLHRRLAPQPCLISYNLSIYLHVQSLLLLQMPRCV